VIKENLIIKMVLSCIPALYCMNFMLTNLVYKQMVRPCSMRLLKAIFNILNHWRGVIEDDMEERGDEGIQQVETLTEMPWVAFLLVQTSV